MNRLYYTVTDFIMDEYFCQWVIQPDVRSDEFWANWLAQNPYKRKEIEEARDLILLLRTLEGYPPAISQSKIDASLQHLMIKIRKRIRQSGDHAK